MDMTTIPQTMHGSYLISVHAPCFFPSSQAGQAAIATAIAATVAVAVSASIAASVSAIAIGGGLGASFSASSLGGPATALVSSVQFFSLTSGASANMSSAYQVWFLTICIFTVDTPIKASVRAGLLLRKNVEPSATLYQLSTAGTGKVLSGSGAMLILYWNRAGARL